MGGTLSCKIHTCCSSLRDVQKIDVVGRQFGLGNTLRKWYADATSIPYGLLMIDLSPKTNDLLRYSTDVAQMNDQKSGLLHCKAF